MMTFTTKLHLPILDREVRYSIINNNDYFNIIKFITNKDDQGLENYFEHILSKIVVDKSIIPNLTNLEKFLILLDNRSITIGDSLQLKGNNTTKIQFSIASIKNNIINNIKDLKLIKKIEDKNFKIELSIPKSLIIDDFDKIYREIINKIQVEEDIIDTNNLTTFEKDSIISNLPATISGDILDFIKQVQDITAKINIISENEKMGLENVPANVFDSTFFMFLKSIFTDDLNNFYELQFQLIHKIKISYDHFMGMTPNECKIYINLYNAEIKKQEEAESKASSSIPSMPSFPSMPKFR